MVAHRTLYEARPAARYLTEFYLWMSLGGALGGLSAALIAPKHLQRGVRVSAAAGAVDGLPAGRVQRRGHAARRRQRRRPARARAADSGQLADAELTVQDKERLLMAWLLFAAGLLVIYWVPWADRQARHPHRRTGARRRSWSASWSRSWCSTSCSPPRQLVAALLVFCALVWLPSGVKRGEAQRSYFGVYRVQTSSDGQYHTLMHGTTLHGAQRIRDDHGKPVDDTTPATYYYAGSPMAQTIAIVRERRRRRQGTLRRDRAGRRLARLPLQARRGLALLRDRSGGDRHRQQPEPLHVPAAAASPSPTSCSAMRA